MSRSARRLLADVIAVLSREDRRAGAAMTATQRDQRRPHSRSLAWSLVGVTAAGFTVLSVLDVRRDGAAALKTDFFSGVLLVVFFVGLGTLLELRQPRNPIGWLLTAGGMTWLVNGLAETVARDGLAHDANPTTLTLTAAAINQNAWLLGVLCSIGLPLLCFPDGRTRSRQWRWVLRIMVVACAVTLAASVVSVAPIDNPANLTEKLANPWGVERIATLVGAVRTTAVALLVVTILAAAVGIVGRFGSASGIERQQLRWVLAGAVLAVSGVLSVYIGSGLLGLPAAISDVLVTVGIACLPVAFTVAVLRYRLYDLGRVVSRTVSYAVLTALLLGVYLGLVTASTRLVPNGSSLAVAASTLAAAALFQPLRRRVQAVIDRRFNRARYDADRTVEVFTRRLREKVDLDAVRADLLAVVDQTLEPSHAVLWLRPGRGSP
jgi:hypothetical protein